MFIVEIIYFYFILFLNLKFVVILKCLLFLKDFEKVIEVDKGKFLVICYLYCVVLIIEGNFVFGS